MADHDDVPSVHPEQVDALEGALLLDVREQDEWDAGHAPGARHVPLGELEQDLAAGGGPREGLVVAVCRSGRRSAEATRLLRAAGADARNLAGGMQAWAAAGRPVQRPDGSAGTVA